MSYLNYHNRRRRKKWRLKLLRKPVFWKALCDPDHDLFTSPRDEALRKVSLLVLLIGCPILILIPPLVSLESHPWVAVPCLLAMIILCILAGKMETRKVPTPRSAIAGIILLYLVMATLGWRDILIIHGIIQNPAPPAWRPGDPVERSEK